MNIKKFIKKLKWKYSYYEIDEVYSNNKWYFATLLHYKKQTIFGNRIKYGFSGLYDKEGTMITYRSREEMISFLKSFDFKEYTKTAFIITK